LKFEKSFIMPRSINPAQIFTPSNRQSHGIVHSARARRLVIGGQFGILPDGTVAVDIEKQFQAAWDNITAILNDAGMSIHNLLRVVVVVTVPGSIHTHRQALENILGGHRPVVNYMEVSGLAQPEFLVSIEAEAIVEDSDALFDEIPSSGVASSVGSYAKGG
jgi:2-iminobutanoate/2-iminopropanoate deaminase